MQALDGCRCPSPCGGQAKGTHLFFSLDVLGQLDLAHAASADGLSEGPCARGGGGDGGPALVDGLLLHRPGIDSYAVDGHCGSRRRVRRIPRVSAPARVWAGRLLAAADGRVVGDAGLVVVATGDVGQGGLLLRRRRRRLVMAGGREGWGWGLGWGGGAGGGGLGAIGSLSRPARSRRGAHDGGRGWGGGRRHGEDAVSRWATGSLQGADVGLLEA